MWELFKNLIIMIALAIVVGVCLWINVSMLSSVICPKIAVEFKHKGHEYIKFEHAVVHSPDCKKCSKNEK